MRGGSDAGAEITGTHSRPQRGRKRARAAARGVRFVALVRMLGVLAPLGPLAAGALTIALAAALPATSFAQAGKSALDRAREFDQAGDAEKALPLYLDYLKSAKPTTAGDIDLVARVHFRVALLLQAAEKPKAALQHLDAALKLKPDFGAARLTRAMNHSRGQRYKLALQDFDRLLAGKNTDEADYVVHFGRGVVRFQLEQYDGVIADMSRAIELHPERPSPYRYRGLAHAVKRNYAQALKDIGEALSLSSDPTNLALLYTDRATIHARRRRYPAAIEDFTRALQNNGRYFLAWHGRGRAKYEMGSYREAIFDLDSATRLQPNFAISWRYLGVSHFMLGHYTESAETFAEFVRLQPKDVYGALWKHVADHRAGRKSTVLADYLKAAGSAAADGKSWPYRAIALYTGRISAADYARFISTGKPPLRGEAACAARFHLAQYHLIAGKDVSAARKALAGGAKIRDRTSGACRALDADLKRLGK